jgi:hypothetical protein
LAMRFAVWLAVCICISQFAQSFVSAIANRQFLSPS